MIRPPMTPTVTSSFGIASDIRIVTAAGSEVDEPGTFAVNVNSSFFSLASGDAV